MRTDRQLDLGDISRIRRDLLAWYDRHGRDLPWRKTRDPYRIWLSEVMLQQTRVTTVVPRYRRFLRRFPSVRKLAAARTASVLAEWSGLGYYHRARNLHQAAKIIVREHKGKFPQTAEAWRTLPGIGRYTAAAIASIAFNEPIAVLDGNVERVLGRLFGTTFTARIAWNTAQELLHPQRPGDFNQAMMELGATVCVPGQPLCGKCPIRKFCRSRGRVASAPRKPRQHKRRLWYSLAVEGDSVLLVRRSPDESLMSGMWELPERNFSAIHFSAIQGEVLFTVRHSITNTDYMVSVVASSCKRAIKGTWIKFSRLNTLPLTGLTRKILCQAKIIE